MEVYSQVQPVFIINIYIYRSVDTTAATLTLEELNFEQEYMQAGRLYNTF
jgi:hypothetical protein